MRRRQFIAGLGSAAAWPPAGGAQQAERVRVIGLLSSFPPDGFGQKAAAALPFSEASELGSRLRR
jgi:hypothetical protein